MAQDPQVFLKQNRDYCDKVIAHTKDMSLADFKRKEIVQLGVIKLLEMIGEACNKLENNFRATHPEIPWRPIIGMRNRTVHEYWDINLPIVWKTAIIRVPELRDLIAQLIDPE